MKRVTIIAAADEAWGIGLRGRLPWSLPEDLAFFRMRTMGLTVIVGRKTFESLPKGLPGRYVVTVSASGSGDFSSVKDAVLNASGEEAIIAGGSGIYREALDIATYAEITRVPGIRGCDTFMPDLKAAGWRLASSDPLGTLQLETWKKA